MVWLVETLAYGVCVLAGFLLGFKIVPWLVALLILAVGLGMLAVVTRKNTN